MLNLTDLGDWQRVIKYEIALLGTKRDPRSWQRGVCWQDTRHTKCSIFYSLKLFFPEPGGWEFTSCVVSRAMAVFLSHGGGEIRGRSAGARQAADR